jgi:CopA family copper-resistance protein
MNHGAMAHPSATPHSADNGVPLAGTRDHQAALHVASGSEAPVHVTSGSEAPVHVTSGSEAAVHGAPGNEAPADVPHDHASHSMSHPAATPPATHVAPTHPQSESSPLVDMQVSQPNTSLNDPGIGLRNTGRRVLTYADLHTLGGPIDRRPPSRNIELHLTGHMQRFVWSFNGQKFSEAEPLRFRHGERLRIVLVNDTMMHHPIHLHGMWSEVENETGDFRVRKHTVTVQPAQRLSYLVTADALGRWAYHCHLLYHMEAGMFREVVVAHEADHAMEHEEHGQ